MSIFIAVIAILWFSVFSLCTIKAVDVYNANHLTKAGGAGFIMWLLLAVLPAAFILQFAWIIQ